MLADTAHSADSAAVLRKILGQRVSWQVWVNLPETVVSSRCLEKWQPQKSQLEFWGMDSVKFGDTRNWDTIFIDNRSLFHQRGRFA